MPRHLKGYKLVAKKYWELSNIALEKIDEL